MNRGMLASLMLGVCALLWPVSAGADELADLKQELEAQKMKNADLENRINQLEARQRLKERSMQEKIDAVAAESKGSEDKAQEVPDILKWAGKLQWSGDFRYRYEYIDDEAKSNERNRNRIRARLGLDVAVNDEWDLGFRIASGVGDPVSTNQTLDEAFSGKGLWLDRAYADYHPTWMEGLDVLAGKFGVPFYKVGKNQMMWDGDLNVEGGALQYVHTLGPQTDLRVSGGGFWVNEESGGADTGLWGLQGYVKHQIDKPTYILAGAGFFDYGNIKGAESLAAEWDDDPAEFSGNTSTDPNVYASDFDIVELFCEVGTEVGGLPVAAWGDWVKNTGAVNNEDTGWLIGGRINKAKARGSWEVSYDYRDIEADAVVGQFNDSDFIGGGTGGKGHRFGLAYALAKNVKAALTYFDSEYESGSGQQDYNRLQADVVLKF